MKKWTVKQIRPDGIVDYNNFNEQYSAYKASLNGTIDRTMTPSNALDANEKVDSAFHRVWHTLRGDMAVLTDNTVSALGYWRGLSYDTYGGGWVNVDSFQQNEFKDGFCHWEYGFHYAQDIYYDLNNPKRIQLRLLFDGLSVAEVTPITRPIGTFRVVADFPCTAGTKTITIQARNVSASDTENTETLFHLTSQQHFMIGRWR